MAAEHHFGELDIDVSTTPITVAGIGDMSGDVFGNGLLRSPAVRLIAAFDHRHVFIDPDPESAAAFEERRRLFAQGRSSWADYDPGLISSGGGVWPRDAKRVSLPPEARAALGVDAAELAMPDLVAAVLRAPVDLLYAAGIGTFVKADDERHEDADDRANDAVRVDASGIRARVVVEGGNLAFTQRARVQYARRGGRINTDAIDNAAGVDTSDHEVNLKLLLALAESDGLLGPAERDDLLADVADDVTATVLRDVALQTDLLSREVAASPAPADAYEALMTDLAATEGGPGIDRGNEALPTTPELRRRAAAEQGLTRPELAVLLAHAKVDLAEQLTLEVAPDSPTWRAVLCGYYPQPVADRFCDLLHDPRLRSDLVRAIVATVVANDVVNRMGITYAHRTARERGVTQVEVARAYWAAREVTGADALWREVEGLDPALGAVAHELHREIHDLVDALARGYVRDAPEELDAAIEQDRDAFLALAPVLTELDDDRRAAGARADRYQLAGVPSDLAARVASLRALTSAPDVAMVARSTGLPFRHVAEVFAELARALPLERLARAARRLEPSSSWERWQQHGLLDDLRSLRRHAARTALAMHPDGLPADAARGLVRRRAQAAERLDGLMALLEEERCADPAAAVAVAVRALGDVVLDGGAASDGRSIRAATGSPA